MEPMLVIALLIAFVTIAALGLCAGVLVTRHRAGAESGSLDGVVERVVSIAGESFDSRLQTGTAELEHRRQAIDDHLEAVVTSLAEKIDSVDKLVAERVGGMSETVGERVGGMSKSLGHQVQTMGNELTQLRNLVGQLQKERAQQHGQFVESLEAATRQQQVLAETTQHLREALASPQARGQWGERMAEDVLRAAGMREGINYRKQRAIEGGTRPDFTFLLPDDQHLHMDVKFPVDNYLRYLEAPSEAEAAPLRERFLKDVRDRVKELNGRGYAATDSTVGYLLLFIPNESVYGFIHENDAALL
ncbi:MAG: DNA recombination protein RmuC, partial [Acidimicrobiia bacterium]|nr:DNA recombination protein RmuC [Acidimicrobiia bacterium]